MTAAADSAVGVIGVGYVGLVTAACFADLGHNVVCRDINPQRVADLRAGKVPIYEPGVDRLLDRNRERLTFTEDMADVFARCRVVFVCVDTPPMHSGQENHVEGSQAGQWRSDPMAALRGFLMEKGVESAG